jgi:hypothetical protein
MESHYGSVAVGDLCIHVYQRHSGAELRFFLRMAENCPKQAREQRTDDHS